MIMMLWVASKTRRGSRHAHSRRFASTTLLKEPVTGTSMKPLSTPTSAPMVPDAPPPPPPPATKPASDVLAGATARAASQATIHPLDTLKVRLQAGAQKNGKYVVAKAQTRGMLQSDPYATMNALGKKMGKLYKGVLGAACGAGIAVGAYFAVYSVATNIAARRTNLKPGVRAFLCGGIAAAGSSVVKVPLAVCIRSVQAGVYSNAFDAARSITSAAGARGLFTGYLPTVLEDVPDMAFKFACYETLRSLHQAVFPKDRSLNAQEDFVIGAIAGAFAAAATTPLDVIKTNMMCTAAQRPTMLNAATAVLKQDGLAGFFKGVGPRAASNGINSAVFFCFFEALRTVISKQLSPNYVQEVAMADA